MKILEMLSSENKKKYRELSKKLHPDVNKEKDSAEKMVRLNNAKLSDKALESFYNEIMGKKDKVITPENWKEKFKQRDEFEKSEKEKEKPRRPSVFKSDEEWEEWRESIKKKKAV